VSIDSEIAKKAIKVNLAYQKTFATPEGKTVIADLMTAFGFFSTTFDSDPQVAAFNEGARAAILRIVDTINIDIEEYIKMMETANQEVFDED